MWWKVIVNWLRDKVDIDVDLDVEEGEVRVSVTVKVGGVTVFTEQFSWPLPSLDLPLKLASTVAHRQRLAPRGA